MNLFGSLLSRNEEQTRSLAKRLASMVGAGDVLALSGELGAGKTRFVQGIALGLGNPPDLPVTSPTFTLLSIHENGRLPLYHFDFYRLENKKELERIGIDEFIWGEGLCVIEWADRIPEALPDDSLWIDFSFVPDGRQIQFRSSEPKWRPIVEKILEES